MPRARSRPSIAVIIPAALAVALLAVPLIALVIRAPWGHAWELLSAPEVRTALRLSLVSSISATLIVAALGIPLAWVLARHSFPGRSTIYTLTTVTMVLPPVVAGVALLLALGRRGVVGRLLDDWFGLQLPFTMGAVIVAEAFVALPFLVLTVEGAFRSADRDLEEAAATLGASRLTVFRRVTLPAVRPSLAAGLALAWARALGEFGATITFAGNFSGRTQTMPLAVYLALESNPDAAILLSLLLVAVSFGVLFALRGRWVGVLGTPMDRPGHAA